MSSNIQTLTLRRKFAVWTESPSTNKPRILEWTAQIRVFVKKLVLSLSKDSWMEGDWL